MIPLFISIITIVFSIVEAILCVRAEETTEMDENFTREVHPFDSFRSVYKLLTAAGYIKLCKSRNRCTEILHKIYRVMVIGMLATHNVQHIIYAVQVRNDNERFLEAVMVELPEAMLIVKVIILYMETKTLDKINDIINDPIFIALNEQDKKYLSRNKKFMQCFFNFTLLAVTIGAVFWAIDPIFRRMSDANHEIPSYIPFDTSTWNSFCLANILDKCTVFWIGYSYFTIDVLIGNYYALARVQLRIINYNLERLFHPYQRDVPGTSNTFQYLDALDKTLHKRFVHYVKRYDNVVLYTNEVTKLLSIPITTQFILTAFTTCLVVTQMSRTDSFSMSFIYLIIFYLFMQFQIIVYCFFAGFVDHESRFVATSVYMSDWQSLSPRFRRLLAIAMTRWIIPITPKVSGVIPLSPATFVTVTRAAYTLYTVLKGKNDGDRTLAF